MAPEDRTLVDAYSVRQDPEVDDGVEDTLELLADPKARREIERARKEIASGRGIRADELRARYLKK